MGRTLLQEVWKLDEIYYEPDSVLEIKDYMLKDDENFEKYQEYITKAGKLIKRISPNIIVKQYSDVIYCLDTFRKRILFYAEYTINNNANYLKTHTNNTTSSIKFGKYIEIQSIYRDAKYEETLGLPIDLYLKYFIPQYHTIFSNTVQSNLGRKFWTSLVKNAFNNSLNVYVINLESGWGDFKYDQYDVVKFSNYVEFQEFSNKNMIWNSTTSDYASVRLVISDKRNIL
jgi:hypothetical protein